jgi:hypothetical protein
MLPVKEIMMYSTRLLVLSVVLAGLVMPAPTSVVSVSSQRATIGTVYAADSALPQKPWTEEDLLEIAKYYDRQAERVHAQAVEFEQKAASITAAEDPKGFRRSSLSSAATIRRKEAEELRQRAAMHRQEAQRFATGGTHE